MDRAMRWVHVQWTVVVHSQRRCPWHVRSSDACWVAVRLETALLSDGQPRVRCDQVPGGDADVVLGIEAADAEPQRRPGEVWLHADGGVDVLVVTRSPGDIQNRASQATWVRHNDGYWSSQRKRTFQRGISEAEIERLARRAGMSATAAAEQHLLRPVPAACQLLLTGTPP